MAANQRVDTHPTPAKSQRRPSRRDRGSTAVELAIGAPIGVFFLLLVLQLFFWGMGWLAAQSAADHAAQTARVIGGSETAGHADADALLAELGGRFIDNPTVAVQRGAQTTTVTISGTAHGLPLPITITVHAPTERSGQAIP